MNKEEDQRIIAKRLRMSDRQRWANLSAKERKAVVEKYYDLSGIKSVGLRRILEDNVVVRRSLALMLMGLLLGVLGSIVASIVLKYFPSGILFDVLIIVGFITFLFWLLRGFNKALAEHLGEDDVLGHLLDLVKKEQNSAQKQEDSQT